MSLAIVIGIIVATAVPIVVLFMIRKLDLYGTGSFRTVIMCFVWGVIAFGISYGLNTLSLTYDLVTFDTFRRFTAPIIEEIFKGLILVYLVRQKNFTYFVDGAIYGFAAGIGFAVAENYFYMFEYGNFVGIAVSRVLSTNLVHATGSSLIGIALGFARFHGGLQRAALPLGGLILAIAFHMMFNNMVTRDVVTIAGITFNLQQFVLLYAIAVGFAGMGLIIFAIRRGIAEGKAWVEDKIDEIERVTEGEAELAKRLPTLRDLLKPVAEQFGEEKARQSEHLITLQARLGIYTATLEKLPDEKMQKGVQQQIVEVTAEMEALRKQIGAYCMLYLRGIIPEDISPLWKLLDERISQAAAQKHEGPSVWTRIGKKTATTETTEPASGS